MTDETPAPQTPAAAPTPAVPATPVQSAVEQRAAYLQSHPTDGASPGGTAPVGTTPAPQSTAAPASKPDWLPEAFWDKDKGAAKGDDFKKHLESQDKRIADFEAARGGVPAKAEDYKTELDPDFKLPEGQSMPAGYEFNQNDPRLIALRKIANETGMSQKMFSGVLGIEAMNVVEGKKILEARDQALGENAGARLGELATWLDASFDKDTAFDLKGMFWNTRTVKAFETMKKALTSQGVGSFNASGREAPDANDGKPSNWAKLSNADRIAWFHSQQREGARPARH